MKQALRNIGTATKSEALVGGLALAATAAFVLVPTPLWPIYIESATYTHGDVGLAFAVYAVGIMACLGFAGNISDHVGRNAVVVSAVGLELAAALMLASSDTLLVVATARLISGIGIGLITPSATAALLAMGDTSSARVRRSMPSVIVGCTLGGFAWGSFSSSLMVSHTTKPLSTPYVAYATGLAAVLLLALLVGADRQRPISSTMRPVNPLLTLTVIRRYPGAATTAATVNVLFGGFTTTAPSIAQTNGPTDPMIGGTLVATMFLSSAAAQLLTTAVKSTIQLPAGLLAFLGGLAAFGAAAATGGLTLLAIAAVLLGSGAGILFRSALTHSLARSASNRTQVAAGIYLCFYLGLTIPVLCMGLLIDQLGTWPAVVAVSAGAGLLAIAGTLSMVRSEGTAAQLDDI